MKSSCHGLQLANVQPLRFHSGQSPVNMCNALIQAIMNLPHHLLHITGHFSLLAAALPCFSHQAIDGSDLFMDVPDIFSHRFHDSNPLEGRIFS
ncbi:hypothetical protein D3C81_1946900 [compost metagenome]